MSWWDTQMDLTNGEFVMAIFAGIGMATCIYHLAKAIAIILDNEQVRRNHKAMQKAMKEQFPPVGAHAQYLPWDDDASKHGIF
jgi:hypothetical protein